MDTNTVLWLIGAGIAALLVAVFQYYYKPKARNKKRPLYAFLRFLTVFGLLILLINPTFTHVDYEIIKPKLVVLTDNSQSMAQLEVTDLTTSLNNQVLDNSKLKEYYDVISLSFGKKLNSNDTLNFQEKYTDIDAALASIKQVYADNQLEVLLLSDGNQTIGNDYTFTGKRLNFPVNTLVLGDTTQYDDVRITRLNVNRYSYLDNKYPVEVIVEYQGDGEVRPNFQVKKGNVSLYSKQITLNKNKRSEVLNFTLPATAVGVQRMVASVTPISSEKNTENNYRSMAVEVIDEQTKVLIVSEIMHPDIGALKKSITSNRQRDVTITTPNRIEDMNDYQLIIWHLPNGKFRNAYAKAEELQKNGLYILGPDSDLSFINSIQSIFSIEVSNQDDDAQPIINNNFQIFDVERFDFSKYPPLKVPFGEVTYKQQVETMMTRRIGNITTEQPLWINWDNDNRRGAAIFGSDIWRWRAASYTRSQSFQNFDDLISAQVQYLASSKKRNRLDLDYKSFYYNNENITIDARYLDQNYQFDDDAILNLQLVNKDTQKTETVPFILKDNAYTANLSGLAAGTYSFTAQVQGQNLARSGTFTIVPLDIEKQFVSANASKMQQLATDTGGFSFTGNEIDTVIDTLSQKEIKPIQKKTEKVIPLIDWKYLLFIIAALLTIEWFLRKYNGLI